MVYVGKAGSSKATQEAFGDGLNITSIYMSDELPSGYQLLEN